MDPKFVPGETNMINETILGTPLPRASSTVARPTSLGNWEERRQALENSESSFLDESNLKQHSIDSSLGILGNISAREYKGRSVKLLISNDQLEGRSTKKSTEKWTIENCLRCDLYYVVLGSSGIVEDKVRQNITRKIDTERELARRLLQRCSDVRESSLCLERDKENNGNVQNLTYDHPVNIPMDQNMRDRSCDFDSTRKILEANTKESAGTSVSFKPNEISARSSALGSTTFDKNFSTASMPAQEAIQFDTSAAAELMAQFGDEDFQSGSRVGSRLLADEISWQQNYPYAMPTNVSSNSGKEHLELSCFSGIIGDVDLSLASENGRKLSFGQFFQRKCGNIGQLEETDTVERPSFGLTITSPKRQGKNVALVDDTVTSEASSAKELVVTETPNHKKQHSLMSLSSIAQALSDIENGSPRRLVDELILAKKKVKPAKQQAENTARHPYQAARHSAASSFIIREKPERDIALSRAASLLDTPKYSLDGHAMPEIARNKLKSTRLSLNFESKKPVEEINRSLVDDFEKERDRRARTSLNNISGNETPNYTKISKDSAVDCSIGTRNASSSKNSTLLHESKVKLSPNSPVDDYSEARLSRSFFKKSPASPMPHEKQSASPLDVPSYAREVKQETNTSVEISPSNCKRVAQDNSSGMKSSSLDVEDRDQMQEVKNSSWSSVDLLTNHRKLKPHENVISTRNTNELFCCVVGVPREAEVELTNKSDRWMTCILSLQQVQGDEENLFLDLPESRILVGPDRGKLIKINVTIRRKGNPLIAVIRIAVTDMVTKSNSSTQHLMCFVPEEPQIGITTPSGSDTLDFHSIAETNRTTLPVTLENMNNASLPLKLNIFQKSGDPQLFSVILPVHDTPDDDEFLLLKSHEKFTFDVQFKGTSLSNLKTANGSYRAVAKLLVQLRTNENNEQIMNGISLVGCIRAAKVELVDTSLPIIVGKSETKPIRIANVGDVAVAVSAMLVENKYVNGHVDDFLLEPNELFLQSGENGLIHISHRPYEQDTTARQVFVKIVAGDNDHYYPVVRENNSTANAKSTAKNGQRCVTPMSRKISAPSSPVSTTSNGSGNSGRHSPLSAASTSTVADDTISIQATHSALMWCSVKTGKNDVKEFSVRNKSDNKIRLQVNIVSNNKCFKFVKDRNTVGSSMLLVLQKKGSKNLSVIFEPKSLGACAGQIQFSHYSVDKEPGPPPKKIFLFGYGGVGRVDISQVFKDSGGLRWLSLGRMNSGGTLSAKFKLRNTGDLRSFARIKLTPKALYPSMINRWHIEPTELVLGPGEMQWVKLEFNPRCEDRAFRKDTSHIGTVMITHGDEPTRLRIRRLYNIMKAMGQLKGCENDDFRNVVFPLCKAFPGETLLKDLSIIKDKVQYLGDLCRGVSQTQIMLTIEVDDDESMTVLDDEVNDTQMFYSVCSDNSSMCVAGCDSYMPTETTMDRYQGESYGGSFTVTPSSVTLAPPYRTEATITVSSCCGVAQPFETFISHTDNLVVVPTQGMIPAGRNFPLKVQCNDTLNHNIEAVLQIFMENDKKEVLITVSCKP